MRLFVAADLPPAARSACAEWRDEVIAERPALRPVADDSLHVTLSFLGSRPEGDVARLSRLLEGCARPATAVALSRGRWLPARRPQVVAVELADASGELTALRCVVAAAVEDPETRPFLPHVSVARVRSGRRVPPDELPRPPGRTFSVAALTLYRSRTEPGGAVYEALWSRAL